MSNNLKRNCKRVLVWDAEVARRQICDDRKNAVHLNLVVKAGQENLSLEVLYTLKYLWDLW